MLKDTKSLGNNKAPACESRGFVHKKRGVHFDTPPCLSFVAFCLRLSAVWTGKPLFALIALIYILLLFILTLRGTIWVTLSTLV